MTDRQFDEARDCYESYYAAVAELRRRWLAGEELPEGWQPKPQPPRHDALEAGRMSATLVIPAPRLESHAHRHAKELLLLWLRIEAQAAGYDGYADFCDLSWRVNRPAPHWGVWTEYPVLADGTGIDRVWDEANPVWRSRPPTFDELRERDEYPAVILDIAIQHKGRIAFGIEIAHKHRCGPSKIEFLRDQLTLIEIPAYWVLGQVDRPTEIPAEFYL